MKRLNLLTTIFLLRFYRKSVVGLLCVCGFLAVSQGVLAQDRFLVLLKGELAKQMTELQKKELPPYYMNYRVTDEQEIRIHATFGVLSSSHSDRNCLFVPQIRVGNELRDNFSETDMGIGRSANKGIAVAYLPIGELTDTMAVLQGIWKEVEKRYDYATEVYKNMKGTDKIKIRDKAEGASFSKVTPERYYELPLRSGQRTVDMALWEKRMKEISVLFKKYPEIESGSASLSFATDRSWFVSTEGAEVVQNHSYAYLTVGGYTRAEDGMYLPLQKVYFAFSPEDLPDMEQILADTRQMAGRLMALREAPVADPYSGPAILSGPASAVFFHEIFGHRVEGQRLSRASDGQTFRKLVGKEVMPEMLQVYDDPALDAYEGQDLCGYYRFDEQGVKGERVNVLENGKLCDFLMTRKPLDGFQQSNGHARAGGSYDPVSRQSNLVVKASATKTTEELRRMLLEEIKTQGKEFGYIFKELQGGFTMANVKQINSFTLAPFEVYRVYADGRPDELVRGLNLIGTPLVMFANIIEAGEQTGIYVGICGAESGAIPVAAMAPEILVRHVEAQKQAKIDALDALLERPW